VLRAKGRTVEGAPDEHLKEAARQLGMQAIRRAEHLLVAGAPQTQLQLIRALVPPMILTARDTGEEQRRLDQLRERMEKLMESAREPGPAVSPADDQD